MRQSESMSIIVLAIGWHESVYFIKEINVSLVEAKAK